MNSIIILDWDDTLFPTSWIMQNNIDLSDKNIQNKYIVFFSKLDLLIYKLLKNLLIYGRVIIVTNALLKWLKLTYELLPNTKNLINSKIDVISAKEKYQKIFPNDNFMWKILVFKEIMKKYKTNSKYQIISVGDADFEFKALLDLYDCENDQKKYVLLKTIRFLKSPSYDILIDELEVFNNSINKIIMNNNYMDLKFQNK